jgi:formamidopyrimidine-DNA glycosylase
MPELPEVETIRRDLCACLSGKCLERVRILRPSVVVGAPRRLRDGLRGREFLRCRRHGKVLILDFADGRSLLIHLRMTGQLRIRNGVDDGEDCPYARVRFRMSDGAALVYADCRALGKLELQRTDEVAGSRALANMGPDALEREGLDRLAEAAGRRRTPIKCLLLDQSVTAGIGNIYASEILHVARIDPARPANDLSVEETTRLRRAVRRVLNAAIADGGTTFSDYRTGLGRRGRYQDRLRVYGREEERCRRRGCRGTIVRFVQQQRSTFYCPECQT